MGKRRVNYEELPDRAFKVPYIGMGHGYSSDGHTWDRTMFPDTTYGERQWEHYGVRLVYYEDNEVVFDIRQREKYDEQGN